MQQVMVTNEPLPLLNSLRLRYNQDRWLKWPRVEMRIFSHSQQGVHSAMVCML